MSAVAALRQAAPVVKPESDGVQRFVLHGVPYQSYVTIADALPDWPIRITYDRGSMEFMTTSAEHERNAYALVILLSIWAEEWKLPIKGYGRTTYRRADLERGMEPDACFYFKNLHRLRRKKRIVLPGDPVPDLVIEVEISRSILDRIGILAALGVKELWRFGDDQIRVFKLDARGRYREQKQSLHLPGLPVPELIRFVRLGDETDDTTMALAFRQWIREVFAHGEQP
jgi:Uma2 family endonuclease